jgi:hypothetical protein
MPAMALRHRDAIAGIPVFLRQQHPPPQPGNAMMHNTIRGSGPKNVILSNGPKITFEWSNLLY